MVLCMGHIQIRNVPEDIHRTLKARAAKEGLSLSEYLLREAVDLAERPTMAEMIERHPEPSAGAHEVLFGRAHPRSA